MNKSISVIIPFYNRKAVFCESIDSVFAQSVQADEIIIVDDASSTEESLYLNKFLDKANIIFLKKNVGVAEARNIGVRQAKSKFVAFLDSDDLWEKDKLEKQLEFMDKNPKFDACHTGVVVFNKNGAVARYSDKPDNLEEKDLLLESQVCPSSLFIKRDIFMELGGFDSSIKCSEDHEFSVRFVHRGYKIGFIGEGLTYLRRMEHGNLSSNGRKILIGHIQLMFKHKELYRKNKLKWRFLEHSFSLAGNRSFGIEKVVYKLIAKFIGLF